MFSATLNTEMRTVCAKFMQVALARVRPRALLLRVGYPGRPLRRPTADAPEVTATDAADAEDPMEIYVDDSKLTLHGLQKRRRVLAENEKNRKLNDSSDARRAFMGRRRRRFVKSVQRDPLRQVAAGVPPRPFAIHASMKQEDRIKLYQSFKDVRRLADRAARLLPAPPPPVSEGGRSPSPTVHARTSSSPRTSGGRGIDIERVNIVVNYDMPARDDVDKAAPPSRRSPPFGDVRARNVDTPPAPRGRRVQGPLHVDGGRPSQFASTEEDAKILEDVQSRFEVSITPLPESIDVTWDHAAVRAPPAGSERAAAAPACTCPARAAREHASAHPRRQPPDTLIHPGRTARRLVSASNRRSGFAPLARAAAGVAGCGEGGGARKRSLLGVDVHGRTQPSPIL